MSSAIVTEDGRCLPKIYWTQDEIEQDCRIDAIAEILERSGLAYVESRRAAKQILGLPRELAPRITVASPRSQFRSAWHAMKLRLGENVYAIVELIPRAEATP